jgi:hypothetical protein
MGEKGDNLMFLDSVFIRKVDSVFFDLQEKAKNQQETAKSILFSRYGITERFFTEDSKLYITPREQKVLEKGMEIRSGAAKLDGVSTRIVEKYQTFRPKKDDFLYNKFLQNIEKIKDSFQNLPEAVERQFTLVKLWNLSVVGAILLGMVSMTFIYKYLGVGSSASGSTHKVVMNESAGKVLGAEDIQSDEETVKYISEILEEIEKGKNNEFEKEIREMVKGHPIEKMIPYIMEKDRIVAAFLVGIARKESNWGKRVPVLNGEDCYNYWGYRGIRKRMGTGGHTCFDSRKDAVDTVAKRLKYLIEDKKLNTPAKMSIWKCGSACNKDGQVNKWISDVDIYFKKLND